MAEFAKCPTTLTCLARQQLVYSEPGLLASAGLSGKGDFCRLLGAIQTASKIISRHVRQSASNYTNVSLFGDAAETPVKGMLAARSFAHETLVHYLETSGQLCVGSSDTNCELIIPPKELTGEFCVVFDPLDGYSAVNPDSNSATIFGIYRRVSNSGESGQNPGNLSDILQQPKNLIASGYTVYGTNTIMVFAMGGEVNGFTLDSGIGEFVLSKPKIVLPSRGTMYSINEGLSSHWDESVAKYVACCKRGMDDRPPYSLRYVAGTLVGNVHSVLCNGGIFMCPSDAFCCDAKYHLLHKCGPLSFIFHAAGGRGYTGSCNVEDAEPKCLEHHSPIFIGSKGDVDELEGFLRVGGCGSYHARSAGA